MTPAQQLDGILLAWADDALDPAERARVDALLTRRPDLRQRAASLSNTSEQLRQALAVCPPPPSRLDDHRRARLRMVARSAERRERRRSWPMLLLVAAGLLFCLTVAGLIVPAGRSALQSISGSDVSADDPHRQPYRLSSGMFAAADMSVENPRITRIDLPLEGIDAEDDALGPPGAVEETVSSKEMASRFSYMAIGGRGSPAPDAMIDETAERPIIFAHPSIDADELLADGTLPSSALRREFEDRPRGQEEAVAPTRSLAGGSYGDRAQTGGAIHRRLRSADHDPVVLSGDIPVMSPIVTQLDLPVAELHTEDPVEQVGRVSSPPARPVSAPSAPQPASLVQPGWALADIARPLLPAAPHDRPEINPWHLASDQPLATFGLDVGTASLETLRRYVTSRRQLPPAAMIRVEELVNAVALSVPPPLPGHRFAAHMDGGPDPMSAGLRLLRVSLRASDLGRDARRPLYLVLAVDASGSMGLPERLGVVQAAMRALLPRLDPADRITLMTCAEHPRVVLEDMPASQHAHILSALSAIQAGGPTNLAVALRTAYQLAARAPAGTEARILLASDGVATIGPADAQTLLQEVEIGKGRGVGLTTLGVGVGPMGDAVLMRLANAGDGSYHGVSDAAGAERVVVETLSASLRLVARDARAQVRFDPRRVRRWRQLGYEQRAIAHERFRDDSVVAGAVGPGQQITILFAYEPEPGLAAGTPLGTLDLRWRDVADGAMHEQRWNLPSWNDDSSDPGHLLAVAAAQLGELLRGSPHLAHGGLQGIERVLQQVITRHADPRAAELLQLVRQLPGLPRGE